MTDPLNFLHPSKSTFSFSNFSPVHSLSCVIFSSFLQHSFPTPFALYFLFSFSFSPCSVLLLTFPRLPYSLYPTLVFPFPSTLTYFSPSTFISSLLHYRLSSFTSLIRSFAVFFPPHFFCFSSADICEDGKCHSPRSFKKSYDAHPANNVRVFWSATRGNHFQGHRDKYSQCSGAKMSNTL